MIYFSLREYMRSESEKSFNECQIRRARLKSLGLAYLSPQNKSLAQSFRYMRTKPTIIAFKTPSLENCDQKQSSSSFGTVGKAAWYTQSQKIRIFNLLQFDNRVRSVSCIVQKDKWKKVAFSFLLKCCLLNLWIIQLENLLR